ncbi:MAG: hypothetical protein WCG47_31105 [Dermatophilaceae bacterium]
MPSTHTCGGGTASEQESGTLQRLAARDVVRCAPRRTDASAARLIADQRTFYRMPRGVHQQDDLCDVEGIAGSFEALDDGSVLSITGLRALTVGGHAPRSRGGDTRMFS